MGSWRAGVRGLVATLALCGVGGCYLDSELTLWRPPPSDAGADPFARPLPPPPECGPDRQPSGRARLPRNILFFLGDGMGVEHVAAGRALAGGSLRMDELAYMAQLNSDSTTTDSDPLRAPTDSAAGATAFATGTRVANGRLALDDSGERLESALDLAQAAGKVVGLVTTSFLYDASPMAFAVHVTSRNAHQDIVEQLLARTPIDVLMGGAAGLLDDAFIPWRSRAQGLGYRLVRDSAELTAVSPADERFVLGLFTPHLSEAAPYAFATTPVLERDDRATDPDLRQMTERALALLSRSAEGFFLFVENEHIDSYAHLGPTTAASQRGIPHEVLALDEAVGAGLDWVAEHSSFEETLVLVSADHETGDYRYDPDDPLHGAFGTAGHTRGAVPLYASGPGTDRVHALCRTSDLFALLTGRPY